MKYENDKLKIKEVGKSHTELSKNSNELFEDMPLIKFLAKYFDDSPDLEEPVNICKEFGDNLKTMKDILYNQRHKQFASYIGDKIVKDYKMDDQCKQSVWSSDASRSTFIIKEKQWKNDKKGIMFSATVLNDILSRIHLIVSRFIQKCKLYNEYKFGKYNPADDSESESDSNSESDSDNESNKTDEYTTYFNTLAGDDICQMMRTGNDILSLIAEDKLKKDILAYMAPHFNMNMQEALEKRSAQNTTPTPNKKITVKTTNKKNSK